MCKRLHRTARRLHTYRSILCLPNLAKRDPYCVTCPMSHRSPETSPQARVAHPGQRLRRVCRAGIQTGDRPTPPDLSVWREDKSDAEGTFTGTRLRAVAFVRRDLKRRASGGRAPAAASTLVDCPGAVSGAGDGEGAGVGAASGAGAGALSSSHSSSMRPS